MNNEKVILSINPNADASQLVETLLTEYHDVTDNRSVDEVIDDLKQRGVVFEHLES